MRRFLLRRVVDVTGVSGTGVVCEGVEFTSGVALVHWRTPDSTTTHYPQGVAQIRRINGHGGATIIEWLDGDPNCPLCAGTANHTWPCSCMVDPGAPNIPPPVVQSSHEPA